MREPPQKVVVNATPIIALALVGRLNLLQLLYDEVVVPPAVMDEVLAGGPGAAGSAQVRQATWIRTVTLQDPQRADLLSDLDRGEAEVISLAQEMGADLVIID
jgi:predicted nucleic acid-binding protein